jgi:hypothetical protein
VVYVDYSTCFVPCFISLNIVDKLKIKTTLVNESRSKLTTSKPKCAQQWVGDCCLTPNEQCFVERRVWRYQRGNQNPYIEEEHTIQWTKDKVRKDKQRSTKHTYKTKDRVTRTPLKTGDELRCSETVSSSCSTSGTRRVNLVTNPVISREWGKDREVLTTCRSLFVLLVLFCGLCGGCPSSIYGLLPLISSNSSYIYVITGKSYILMRSWWCRHSTFLTRLKCSWICI